MPTTPERRNAGETLLTWTCHSERRRRVASGSYKIWSVHYVSPADGNRYQAQKMTTHGLFSDVHDEVGDVIVADVSVESVRALLAPAGIA